MTAFNEHLLRRKDEKLPLAILIYFNFYLSIVFGLLIGRLVLEKHRNYHICNSFTQISLGPGVLHLADSGDSSTIRRNEGNPEGKALRNGGIFSPFVLSSGLDYTLHRLPPRNNPAVRHRARDDDVRISRHGIGARVEILAFDHHKTISPVLSRIGLIPRDIFTQLRCM